MIKRFRIFAAFAILLTTLSTGCQKETPTVSLSIWTSAGEQEVMEEMIEAFKKKYADDTQFEITISKEDEKTCRDTVLSDPKGAADLYTFASDQFDDLQRENALLPITDQTDQIIAENGDPVLVQRRHTLYLSPCGKQWIFYVLQFLLFYRKGRGIF